MRWLLQPGHDSPLPNAGPTLTLPAAILRGAARGLRTATPGGLAPPEKATVHLQSDGPQAATIRPIGEHPPDKRHQRVTLRLAAY